MKARNLQLLLRGVGLLLVITMLPLVTACSTSAKTVTTNQAPVTTTPVQAPVAVKEWDFPLISSLTGPASVYGFIVQRYVQLAVTQINAAGGIRGVPVKVTAYDDATDATQVVAVAAKVIPGSLLLLGPIAGTVGYVSQTITTNKIPDFGMTIDPALRAGLEPYSICPESDVLPNGIDGAEAWLALNPNIKKVAFYYYSGIPYDFANQAPPALARMGVTVDLFPIDMTQTDLTPQVTKAISNGDQGFIDMGSWNTFVSLAQALYNRGITQGTEIFGGSSVDDPSLFTVGKGYLENSYVCENSNPLDTSDDKFVQLVAAYKAQYGGAPPVVEDGYYDIMFAIKQAIETLGITGDPSKLSTERTELANYLFNSPLVPGLQGPYKFVNGQRTADYALLQIKNNQYVYVQAVKDVPVGQ